MTTADGPGGATPAAERFRGEGRGTVTEPEELLAVDDWLNGILAVLSPLDPIELKVGDALGLVLTGDIVAREPVPAFANSAMDGYAVVAADVAAASVEAPVPLTVAGHVPAGSSEMPTVEPGTAASIMTGAPLPPGADAVVAVETTSPADDGRVRIHRAVEAGTNVRTVGEDVRPGQRLLSAGRRLRPADIGLLAETGNAVVRCHPTPRVVVFSTGDELVPVGQRPGAGQLRDSNSPMLAALVRQAGAVAFPGGIVRDDPQTLRSALDSNMGQADAFVLTGGVSAGAHDHVRDVLATLGETWVAKLAMKPGKPQVFGLIGHMPVFALPGNPVSAFVSFELFVRPALRVLQGRRDRFRPIIRAVLDEPVRASPHKRTYLRVRLDRRDRTWHATTTGGQGSHVLTSVAAADGLAEVPEDVTELPAGTTVNVHLLVDGP